jgi:predicted enzyme related to lactoylglutathione lyase
LRTNSQDEQDSTSCEQSRCSKIDAVTIPVPDLDAGLGFYHDRLGHELRWRNDAIGQVGLGLPGSDSEIVLATRQKYEPNWLVSSADEAAEVIAAAGGRVVAGPEEIAVGRLVVAEDPFGNVLVLLDLSKGRYVTDDTGLLHEPHINPPAQYPPTISRHPCEAPRHRRSGHAPDRQAPGRLR